ncbi:NASP-related protein sim3 [Andrographis paniculata]|uniref:NASP-related protein sim3 n=1 Tax=Andrographis paniculata TaxID=175694 RepID=UPI0021E79622|nr:NASP-related protein sim3 [Andrographis paniculata]
MAEEMENFGAQAPVSEQNPNSVEATIESNVGCEATESTCNNISNSNGGSSVVSSEDEREKTLEYADELMALGSKAAKDQDYTEATDYYSRALEIRVAHFGELAPECVNAYYKYGCALLYKAQEEADPLASMPKKEDAVSHEGSHKEGSVNSVVNGEASAASASNNAEQGGSSNGLDGAPDNNAEGKVEEEGEDGSDDEELADGEEDESDLDLAWKMLDVARIITEKHSGDTMEKVDILSALAEVALEREDIETSLSDYLKALAILERLVEPDSRLIAELNFRVCLCLEIGSKPEDAISYCQKAISICKSRTQRLMGEVQNLEAQTPESSTTSQSADSTEDKTAEIETLTGLSSELEKKLEDLQQLVSNPKSILSDILGIISAKAEAAGGKAISGAGSSTETATVITGGTANSTIVSTAQTSSTSEVTHLGVVGRGVKRVVMSSTSVEEPKPAKKPSMDPSSDNCNNGNSS